MQLVVAARRGRVVVGEASKLSDMTPTEMPDPVCSQPTYQARCRGSPVLGGWQTPTAAGKELTPEKQDY